MPERFRRELYSANYHFAADLLRMLLAREREDKARMIPRSGTERFSSKSWVLSQDIIAAARVLLGSVTSGGRRRRAWSFLSEITALGGSVRHRSPAPD